jgi:hypothetical protein
MLRIELNQTCNVGSPDSERSHAEPSLRIVTMLSHVAAIVGALAAIVEILHRW